MLPFAHDTGTSTTPGAAKASHRRYPRALPATAHGLATHRFPLTPRSIASET